MKQTAVEWLIKQLEGVYESDYLNKLVEKAKAMEKEQIMKAFYKGRQEEQYKNLFNNHVRKSEEQYYKETYESKTNI
jgi:hypothetical protein